MRVRLLRVHPRNRTGTFGFSDRHATIEHQVDGQKVDERAEQGVFLVQR